MEKPDKRADGVLAKPEPEKKFEGSYPDMVADGVAAKRRGRTVAEYEDSPADRIADTAGQRRLEAEHAPPEPTTYKSGTPAFQNSPKTAHGFGHPSSARDGHLRNSGSSGAHRIGKKK